MYCFYPTSFPTSLITFTPTAPTPDIRTPAPHPPFSKVCVRAWFKAQGLKRASQAIELLRIDAHG